MERRSSEIEETPSHKSKSQNFFIQKSRCLYQKLGVTQESRGVLFSNCDVTRHVRLGMLRKPRAEPGFEPRFSKDHHSRRVVTRRMRSQLRGNYGRLCQKARNGYCSSIHRLPTNSARIVPIEEEKNFYKFRHLLPHQRHTFTPSQPLNLSTSQPLFISDNVFPKKAFKLLSVLHPLEYPRKQTFQSKSISYQKG